MKKDIVALTRIWGHHQQSPLFLLLLSNILHTITYWKCKIIVVDISPPLVHWYAQLVTIVLQVDSTVSSVCVCMVIVKVVTTAAVNMLFFVSFLHIFMMVGVVFDHAI